MLLFTVAEVVAAYRNKGLRALRHTFECDGAVCPLMLMSDVVASVDPVTTMFRLKEFYKANDLVNFTRSFDSYPETCGATELDKLGYLCAEGLVNAGLLQI